MNLPSDSPTLVTDSPTTPATDWLLAIETSTRVGRIALLRDGILQEERVLDQAGQRHAQALIFELERLLRTHQIRPANLSSIAVSRGPGSFTGLRVGMTAAKTLAYAVNATLVQIPTFAVYAQQAGGTQPVVVVDDAQRDAVFWQVISPDELQSERLPNLPNPEVVSRPDSLERLRAQPWLATGPLAAELSALSGTPHHPQSASSATVGELGWKLASLGQYTTPFAATPLYLRRSAAEEQFDQQRDRG